MARKPINQYTLDGNYVRTWSSIQEIRDALGFQKSSICNCCRMKCQQAHNFQWRYASECKGKDNIESTSRGRCENEYWDYEACHSAALTCKTKKEFATKYKYAYNKSRKNDWLKDYTWFDEIVKPKGYWDDYDRCYEAALGCSTITEFVRKYSTAYVYAKQNDWLKDYVWFEWRQKPKGYWNIRENVDAIAILCSSRNEFKKMCSPAYYSALRHGWIDDYDWFERDLDPYKGNIHSVYAFFFTKLNAVYVGRTINCTRREKEHHKSGSVFNFAKENNVCIPEMTVLETGLSLDDSLIYEDMYIKQYVSEGWGKINSGNTGLGSGSIGSLNNHKWNRNKCYEAAKKCKTRSEFGTMFPSAYNASKKNGWLDDYTWFIPQWEAFRISMSKPVDQYTVDGEFVKSWQSATEVQETLGYGKSTIRRCCKGQIRTAFGYVWKPGTKKAAC